MSYSHSFSSDFYDDGGNGTKKRPSCVRQALENMPKRYWNNMCRDVFHCKPEFVDVDMVMDKIMETDTVGTLSSPVDVWIDPEGYYTIEVYDTEEEI